MEGEEDGPQVVESLCMSCGKQGTTTILLRNVPHFREIILMAFSCPHCEYRNNEVQFGGSYACRGCKCTLKVEKDSDLNRQIIKAGTASVLIPHIDLEIPPKTQAGTISTVEGILRKTVDDLSVGQELRRVSDEESASKIDEFISKINETLDLKDTFSVIIDDPAGNSHIENPLAPASDPQIKVEYYFRSPAQNEELGIRGEENISKGSIISDSTNGGEAVEWLKERSEVPPEIHVFPSSCSSCGEDCENRMLLINIPHFKEVIIMAMACEKCGYKSTEVKSSGSICTNGKRIILKVRDAEDLNRDLLKSDTCSVEIPELSLQLAEGTLGGRFTTIEGLLLAIDEQLRGMHSFHIGDSAGAMTKNRLEEFLDKLRVLREGKEEFTLIIDDPLSNSYVQNVYYPDPDPCLQVEEYKRSVEVDEQLGLLDMKTEGYHEE